MRTKAETQCRKDGSLRSVCRGGLIKYDVANAVLMAQFNSDLEIERYTMAGAGPVLSAWREPKLFAGDHCPPGLQRRIRKILPAWHPWPLQDENRKRGCWRTEALLDGRPFLPLVRVVKATGRIFETTLRQRGVTLTANAFADARHNAVFQRYRLENDSSADHCLEIRIHAEFDLGALEEVKGRLQLKPGAWVNVAYQRAWRAVRVISSAGMYARLGATIAPDAWKARGPNGVDLVFKLNLPRRRGNEFCLVLAAGRQECEMDETCRSAASRWRGCRRAAEQYARWVTGRFTSSSPVLNTMFSSCLNAALSVYKDFGDEFRGFVAGIQYQWPLRAYFRDVYWTVQAVLPFRPELVKEQIYFLARGVHAGECPSAVLAKQHAKAGINLKKHPEDWWSDHYDSPSFFIMLLYDYLGWTGDREILRKRTNGQSIWNKARACVRYLQSCDRDGDALFEKDYCARDWTDVIYRNEWVTYDLALYYRAIVCVAKIAEWLGETGRAEGYRRLGARVRQAINDKLWDAGRGHYVNYRRRGGNYRCEVIGAPGRRTCWRKAFVEKHFSIDTLLTVLYGVADERQSASMLERARLLLQTRHNRRQPYGDWGIMACWPPYCNRRDLEWIVKLAYSYSNSADWPYLDGIYALILLLRGDNDWQYALTRWWRYSIAHNWLTPVEFTAPPRYSRGSLLQGWSAMPAAAMILGGFGFWPNLTGNLKLKTPPWGDCRLTGIRFRDKVYDLEVTRGKLKVWKNGKLTGSPK